MTRFIRPVLFVLTLLTALTTAPTYSPAQEEGRPKPEHDIGPDARDRGPDADNRGPDSEKRRTDIRREDDRSGRDVDQAFHDARVDLTRHYNSETHSAEQIKAEIEAERKKVDTHTAEKADADPENGDHATDKRFNKDQQALVELAKEAKRKKGISGQDADTLVQWGKEVGFGDQARGPESHGTSAGRHAHVGPVNHISVTDPAK